MLIRGIVTQVVQGLIQRFSATGRFDQEIADRELFQQYGYTSRPLPGAELVMLQEGNIVYAVASDDRRYRLALEEGEVALYDDQGQKVHLKRGKAIEVSGCDTLIATAAVSVTVTAPTVTVAASTKVTLDTPLVEMAGNLSVAGGITSTGTYGASGGKISTPGDIQSTGGELKDKVRALSADRAIYNNHTHTDPQGGTVPAPASKM